MKLISSKLTVSILSLVLSVFSQGLAAQSTCFGTTSNGRIEAAVKLPASGDNFVSYSYVAAMAGRTYVHSEVKQIMLASYAKLSKQLPDNVYKYAETGLKRGGRFKPHKTHRNGLSVDFMVPVVDSKGASVHLPTHPLNRFGYDIEFDQADQFEGFSIDYTAMAAHIVELHKAAKARGHDVWRVIFDPNLTPKLLQTKYGGYLKANIQFSKKRSWVRHDEHYHVDFDIACKPLTR